MKLLAFDCSGASCSAACLVGSEIVASQFLPMLRGQAEAMVPLLSDVMAAAGLTFDRLDAVAVTRGPGSFTGLRIGLAAARGLGLAWALPVFGLTGFEAISASVAVDPRPLAVVLDSRRGDIFVQIFAGSDRSTARKPLAGPVAIPLKTIGQGQGEIPSGPLLMAGDAAVAVRDVLAGRGDMSAAPEIVHPGPIDAAGFVREAARRVQAGDRPPAVPLYLREPDVSLPGGRSDALLLDPLAERR
jgi:tRNA threonylcarbamoyladenosine biosynthesis protein TsaB